MRGVIKNLWGEGHGGLSPGVRRQILLSNLLALFGAIATLPYQIFYAIWDISLYLPVFAANVVFMGAYLSTLWLNRAGSFSAARNTVLGNAIVQLAVVTFFIGAGAGVHLFYFALAGMLPLFFYRYRLRTLRTLCVLVITLFVLCQIAFANPILALPAVVVRIFYIGSAIGAMSLVSGFAYLFRVEIDEMATELKTSNRALEKLSTTDGLTGLANRRGMDVFLDEAWGRLQRNGGFLSLIMCDVDYFKPYNDHYGHYAGDRVLQRIAGVLQDATRRPADLAARYGGEEFIVLLPDTDMRDAKTISERIRSSVAALEVPHAYSQGGAFVTISAGISTGAPNSKLTMQQLLDAADHALYTAKRHGRNRVMFEPPSEASVDHLPEAASG